MRVIDKDAVKINLIRGVNRQLGICEQLRIIYDSVYQLPEGEIKEKITDGLVDAMIMAKKMGDRLQYYHDLTHDATGHQGKNLQVDHKPYLDNKELARERKRRQII
jgi:hypothetical protein